MSKPKQHPLEIKTMQDDAFDICGYYSKGHHPLEDFARAVNEQYGEQEGAELQPSECTHVLLRYNPIAPNDSRYGDYRKEMAHVNKPGRGVFPATAFWYEY